MREILFRGKRIDNGEWVAGYYVHLYDHEGNDVHRIYTGYAETDCGDYYPDYYDVVAETVGLYTGLNDKNGKVVFDGDIVPYLTFGMTRKEAVEKQIPKKPVITWDNPYQCVVCPICHKILLLHQDYCDSCGQRLDWSDDSCGERE